MLDVGLFQYKSDMLSTEQQLLMEKAVGDIHIIQQKDRQTSNCSFDENI